MTRPITTAVLTLAALAAAAGVADAQIHQRWRLDYTQEKPRLFTYRDAQDNLENFWYVVYTITNNTDQVVPVLVDHMLYVETGKELLTDIGKVDPDKARSASKDEEKAMALRFGSYHQSVVAPQDVEYRIIEYHAKLGNRSPGIVHESIEEMKKGDEKGNRWYLNPRELRAQRYLRPGQKLNGVAIFRGVDRRARLVEVLVSGLWDVLRVETYIAEKDEIEDVRIVYENRVLKYTYDFKGDEFERERDFVAPRGAPEWVVRQFGPVASKTTIDTLVESLLRVLDRWETLVRENAGPDKVKEEIARFYLTPLDFDVSARVISRALGRDFGWASDKNLYDNREAVWRMHEYWVTNKSRLAYNERTGRFELREEVLPGAQPD